MKRGYCRGNQQSTPFQQQKKNHPQHETHHGDITPTMIVKTKDDQQYGVVTKVINKKSEIYTVQCYGQLSRVGPWIRKCSKMKTFPNGGTSAISLQDVVLIGYNYQDKKTGSIAYVYNRTERYQLISNAEEYEVPKKLVALLEEDGYYTEPDGALEDNLEDEKSR